MNNFAVEINGLEKTYKTESESLTILKNLDLRIEEGSKVVIIGESGSGKSVNRHFHNCITSINKKRFLCKFLKESALLRQKKILL